MDSYIICWAEITSFHVVSAIPSTANLANTWIISVPAASIETPQQTSDTVKDSEAAVTMTNRGSEKESRISQDPQTLTAVEQKLRSYMEDEFSELRRQIDERFEQLMEKVMQVTSA